mgnify:CR=1 FL=1
MDSETGRILTIWLARGAVALYAAALWTRSKKLWTFGFAVYLLHGIFAFSYFYQWSHAVAVRETARQTRELFGVDWAGGIYLNYLFTIAWAADCALSGPYRWQWAVRWFLAFMVLNASVVVWAIRAFRV